MAVSQLLSPIQLPAAVVHTGNSYKPITISTAGEVALSAASVVPDGVLLNEPDAVGNSASFWPLSNGGTHPVRLSGTVTLGVGLRTSTSGFQASTATSDTIVAVALEPGASGELISALLGNKANASTA